MRIAPIAFSVALLFLTIAARAQVDANRLTYLDEADPFYVGQDFPKLTAEQWCGEAGVKAVIVLAVDDLRENAPSYEAMLRPAMDRLKLACDGRAPVSIMTNRIDPRDPKLQAWLTEGVSLEVHTFDHPCPFLAGGDFAKSRQTYDKCVDLLSQIPGNHPVAFRMPCCDSMDSPSPRFYSEIFNKATASGNFLQLDSSVMDVLTPRDSALPSSLTIDADGREKSRKYLPFEAFTTTIENYPYPYLIGRLCWEFPCVVPSDWEAQNLQKPNNPKTVEDMKAALDAVVLKQGTYNLIFHPHGWIKNTQIAELADYAITKYGKSVKFMNFRDALEAIDKNLLAGESVRAADGTDNGVRLLDLDGDGIQDVIIANDKVCVTRLWQPATRKWVQTSFPAPLVHHEKGVVIDAGVRFGIVRRKNQPRVIALRMNESQRGAWYFGDGAWHEDNALLNGLPADVLTAQGGRDRGVRLRDINGDGTCELIVSNDRQQAIYRSSGNDVSTGGWSKAPYSLPEGTSIVDADGRDAGLRFADVDEDGHADVIFSNDDHYSLHLFRDAATGWSKQVISAKRGEHKSGEELPRIVRGHGENNGVWFHSRAMWVQNEDTAAMPNVVDVRPFAALLKDQMPGPRTPAVSAKSIQIRPGFTAELMAAEPLVQDPINMAWDEQGRLWVISMDDYPLGIDGKGKAGGHITILTDTDGDGKFDKATVFMDGLNFPTGVTPWKKGAIITAAPDIFYAEDTDGDGKADKKEVLYTGFAEGNQQHRVNGLMMGLDNWLYGANGHSGGTVKSLKTGAVVELGGGHDFRIKPDEGLIEVESGVTQYGRSRDDWGNWFGCDNSNPNFQFVLPDHYLRRNPNIKPPQSRVDVPEVPGAAPVYPVSRILERFNEPQGAGHFTSANSIWIYRDDLLGPEFTGNSFVSEPVHNLIHREIMVPKGVTFSSHRAPDEQNSEFLASTDNWSRPTGIKTGPDGALWFTDMYRLVIEHPEWIPREWQQRLDLRAGHDMGRVYRIYRTDRPPRKIVNLAAVDVNQLVAALDSPSGWQRDTIQRLLVDRKDKAAVAPLEKLIAESKALARLHALCSLDGMGMLSDDVIARLLADPHPGVVRHAIRVAEPRYSQNAKLAELAAKHVDDEDAQVRLQLAFSLGSFNPEQAGPLLAHLATKNADDRFITGAVLSSVTAENLQPLLAALSSQGAVAPHLLENLVRVASATGNTKSLAGLLSGIKKPQTAEALTSEECESLSNLLGALESAGKPLSKLASDDPDPQLKQAVASLAPTFAAARAVASDSKADEALRAAATCLIGRGPDHEKTQSADIKALTELLTPQTPESIQSAAIEALGALGGEQSLTALTAAWRGFGPAQRAVAMDAMLGRDDWMRAAVAAMEKGAIRPSEIDASRRQRLLQIPDKELHARLEKVFAEVVKPDRQKVIEAFAPAATLEGDKTRGVAFFTKLCATCHRLADIGNSVGPDLASLSNRSPEYLMVQILDPNRAVDAKYTNYVLQTRQGQTMSGIIAAESGNSLTMAFADGKTQSILRSDVKALRSTGMSLMPENLEAGLSPQDLADLMAFVATAGPAPQRKTFPGNVPVVVQPAADGSLTLSSKGAEIYGPSIVLEEKYGNLGYWTSDADHAVWTLEPTRPGSYSVWIEYACDPSAAGNTLLIQSGAGRVQQKVESTGNWDTYKRAKIGQITLRLGKQHVTVRPAGPLNGALLDLKEVQLIPEEKK